MTIPTPWPDALAELHSEHTYLASLFAEMARESDAVRARGLLRTVYEELRAHRAAEQQAFYAVLAHSDVARGFVRTAAAAHERLCALAEELLASPPESPSWRETMQVLQRAWAEHVEAEERELFAVARRVVGGDGLRIMAVRLREAAARWREAECAGYHPPPGGGPARHAPAELQRWR
jgi:hypothetical protein